MIAQRQVSLYQSVVEVTTEYLGPASERFIDRQIEAHLNKQPEKITKRDLVKLVDWLKMVMAVLSDDRKMVDDFTNDLLILTKSTLK